MSSDTENCAIYVVLALAVMAAIMSAPASMSEIQRKLQWFLTTSTSPDIVAAVGVIGETQEFPLPP
jgi:ABC-type glucose/galactose transport system permease subunit